MTIDAHKVSSFSRYIRQTYIMLTKPFLNIDFDKLPTPLSHPPINF
jgi:hypothetical protein